MARAVIRSGGDRPQLSRGARLVHAPDRDEDGGLRNRGLQGPGPHHPEGDGPGDPAPDQPVGARRDGHRRFLCHAGL